jgi:CheY-like chemotaxis protein
MSAALGSPVCGDSSRLTRLLSSVANAIADTLQSLVDRPIIVKPEVLASVDGHTLRAGLDPNAAIVHGTMDAGGTPRSLRLLFDGTDIVTMTSLMSGADDQAVRQRRAAGPLTPDEAESLTELGNVLCAGIDTLLADKLGGSPLLHGARHGLVASTDADGVIAADESLIVYRYRLQVSSYPATAAAILLDTDTAKEWNGGRLGPPGLPTTTSAEKPDHVPDAPIRGSISCYLSDPDVLGVLSRACRRIGLEVGGFGTADVPNPACHRNDLVLLDAPLGHDRRFDWCRRLKQLAPTARVVLLVHHPSRSRVLQAFLAKADMILGWPLDDQALAERLGSLLEPAGQD